MALLGECSFHSLKTKKRCIVIEHTRTSHNSGSVSFNQEITYVLQHLPSFRKESERCYVYNIYYLRNSFGTVPDLNLSVFFLSSQQCNVLLICWR